MIDAGMELARKGGCSSLRIRDVVGRAGVNLGMFHYHFKSRQRFTRILLEEMYGEFFAELVVVAEGPSDPLERLRGALLLLGRFLRKNRRIVFALFRDILNEDPEVMKYARKGPPPHKVLLMGLLEECFEEGLIPRMPVIAIAPLFFGAFAQPLIFAEMAEKFGACPSWFDFDEAMSDEFISQRVDIVLRGLTSPALPMTSPVLPVIKTGTKGAAKDSTKESKGTGKKSLLGARS